MAKLHIIYDPNEKLISSTPEMERDFGFKVVILSTPNNLEDVDIYNISRKLCDLLLEQLSR